MVLSLSSHSSGGGGAFRRSTIAGSMKSSTGGRSAATSSAPFAAPPSSSSPADGAAGMADSDLSSSSRGGGGSTRRATIMSPLRMSVAASSATSGSSGFSSGSKHNSKNLDDSSNHSSSTTNSIAGLALAARFSKKLMSKSARARGVMGMSISSGSNSRRKDEMNDSSRTSATTSGGYDLRTSAILMDPHRHLKTIITPESSPFLSQYMDYPVPAPSMARAALNIGKLIQDGDFCRLQEVIGFKSRIPSSQKQQYYALKSINPNLLLHPPSERLSMSSHSNRPSLASPHLPVPPPPPSNILREDSDASSDDNNNNNDKDHQLLERAVTKMVLEGLYLGHLQHPHILKLRGVAMGGMAAEPEALFLLTDRIGDTLDQRIDIWKQWAMAKERRERKRQHRLKYPPLAPTAVNTESVLKDKLIKTYPDDLIVLKTNYALQILDALQYLHERGIVVRELRPEGIGFCAYPHHHTVQIFDLSSCKEVPRDGSQITPEVIEERPSLMDGSSHRSHTERSSCTTTGSDRHNNNNGEHSEALLGVRTSLAARRYMAPEIFGENGYNTKADLYSWAMIYSELVTETKPYSSRQLMRNWTKIVSGELRPKLQKYHFPRTIKGVLELAWQAKVARRGTAKQLHKSLTTVLHMLEGQGLPWLVDPQSSSSSSSSASSSAAIAAAASAGNNNPAASVTASVAGSDRRKGMGRQKTLARASLTLAIAPTITPQKVLPSLPQRAAHYKRMQAKAPVRWGKVWDPREGMGDDLCVAGVQSTVQSNKDKVFQKRLKANRVEGFF